MKKLLSLCVVLLLVLSALPGCSDDRPAMTSATEAQQYIDTVKNKIRETYKEDYFNTDEWKAFEAAFWKGFYAGQEQLEKLKK